jgi:hypothetical protein
VSAARPVERHVGAGRSGRLRGSSGGRPKARDPTRRRGRCQASAPAASRLSWRAMKSRRSVSVI